MTTFLFKFPFTLLFLISCQPKSPSSVQSNSNVSKAEIVQGEEVEEKISDISTPIEFDRISIAESSFGNHLRNLPLKADHTVYLYNGEKKRNQRAQYAVIDRSPSDRDLMQCADAVIRLRSEFLFDQNRSESISFNFVSGDTYQFQDYLGGKIPVVSGNQVRWKSTEAKPNSKESLATYLDWIYMYAGTASLIRELNPIHIQEMQIGDVFIQSGNPYGHAVIVVDMCKNIQTNQIGFMLAQSYMPAQDLHVLRNPNSPNNSPWYFISQNENIFTPEWTFSSKDLKRF